MRAVPRPERSLDPSAGPVQQFAAELRAVRAKAGDPKYLSMARQSGRSKTALAEAAGGDHLATWETVEAYLSACGQNPSDWYDRWEQVRADLEATRAPSPRPTSATPMPVTAPEPAAPANRARKISRGLVLTGGAMTLAIGGALAGAALTSGTSPSHSAGSTGGAVTVVVQNMVASGPNGFYEDLTPEYLSTKPQPHCARLGCEVANTSMWSGAVLTALCQVQGTKITNANTTSAGIGQNPNAFASARWYKVAMPTGVTGYISEAYLTPASRGGLGLPTCST